MAMRICSTIPSATEILYELGLGDEIVGVSFECDYPEAATRKPLIVTGVLQYRQLRSDQIDRLVLDYLRRGQRLYQVDLEVLRNTRPELVVTQDLCDVCAVTMDDVRAAIRELSPPPQLIALHPHTLGDMLEDIRKVGEATRRTQAALELIRGLQLRIDTVRAKTARAAARPRVLCLEWLKPLMTAGHWVPEMVTIAGGEPGLSRTGQPAEYTSWEAVRDYRPEVIFLMPCGFSIQKTLHEQDLVTGLPGWSSLPAVQAGRVFVVDGNAYYNRGGPRLVDGLEMMAGLIHPALGPWPPLPDGAVHPLR